MKKFLSLLLALVMVFSLVACTNNETNESNPGNSSNPTNTGSPSNTDDPGQNEPYVGLDWAAIDAMDWDDACQEVYDSALGEFYEYYMAAKAETNNLDKRTALMAIAEAKLMESGVFLPSSTNGGNYAMSRIVPRTATTTKWGNDDYRTMYTYRIANELIKKEDRVTLVEIWNESDTADEYFAAAEKWLTDNGYTLTDAYNTSFSDDILTWDCLVTSNATDTQNIIPTVDALLVYDAKNVQQPALATSLPQVSADGLTYTFHIRQGVKWVDQQGREIAEVQADDWVAAMEHLADSPDELGYLMGSDDGCGIKNFDAYIQGDITDFSEVGVKAIDKYTLQYTLEEPFAPFTTMMSYGCFAPLCRSFYESKGGKFGAEFDASAASYTYGKTPADIAYCGAYLVDNYTAGVKLSYKVNPTYWNADAINIKTITYTWNDGTDTLRAYNEAVAGTTSGAGLNSSAAVRAKEDIDPVTGKTYFDAYCYVTVGGVYSYNGWYNLNRLATANFNDDSAGVSNKTQDQMDRFRTAINNQHFRLALSFALDRGSYNAARVGEDLKYARVRNSYVPGDFQYLATDVTVDINGTSTTFPAGTAFGAIVQAQINADGYPMKVFDPDGNDGAGSSDGFDGWYNPTQAVAELQKAIGELAQIGLEITAENPIIVDFPYEADVEQLVNEANVYKQSIENNLNGLVQVNLISCADYYDYAYATFYFRTGSQANYDLAINSGWGPDYGDAQTYLDTLQPESYMTKCLGLW